MDIAEFLNVVVTTKVGYFCLASRSRPTGEWIEQWYSWPDGLDDIVTAATMNSLHSDVYFSSYLFTGKSSCKENALPTRTIQADLDAADIGTLPIQPTICIESSPGRYQAYWIIRDEMPLIDHEYLSKKVTYSIPLCDKSGWPIGRKLRLPGTVNYKYNPPVQVKILSTSMKEYESVELESACHADITLLKPAEDLEWINNPDVNVIVSGIELLEAVKSKIPAKVTASYSIPAKDRSEALWALMTSLFRIDLSRELVFHICKASANNKFKDLQYNADRELAKDILRAERAVHVPESNIKATILELRKSKGHTAEKRQNLLDIVLKSLKISGEFIRTYDDNIWYIPKDLGRPIYISTHSEYLQMVMDLYYGLNSTETEQSYVISGLASYTRALPATAILASLTYYDESTNSIFLHTGRREVIRISPNSIERTVDGSHNILFPWSIANEPFSPSFQPLHDSWGSILFSESLNTCLNIPKEEALAVLQVWFMFILFRAQAVSRPILALFGQPGCLSKDTTLQIKRGEHSKRRFSIEQAYRSFHGRWDKNIPTRILSEKKGIIAWRDIKDITYSGKKLTYIVCIVGHDPICATADHRFLTNEGYKCLSELKPGDKVIVKGKKDLVESSRVGLIIRYKEEETYDIEMMDTDAPNFLVNGVVVHNSGKSTLFRKIYTLLYGKNRSLGSITTPEDFDQAVASDPLVVLDNVDTWERWLPDRLALSAATSDITRRKLYTDSDTVVLKRQALVGISAHNPKFGREDVTDRLILLSFRRLERFIPEGDIMACLHRQRNALWGAIINDMQKVLNTPSPSIDEIPQFRVEDFSRLGMRIARALGIEQDFYNGLTKIAHGQKAFSLEEDIILVQAIRMLINKQKEPEWYTITNLWNQLEVLAIDSRAFVKIYKNSVSLGHKLWSLYDTLRQAVNVEYKHDAQRGSRVWKFTRKEID